MEKGNCGLLRDQLMNTDLILSESPHCSSPHFMYLGLLIPQSLEDFGGFFVLFFVFCFFEGLFIYLFLTVLGLRFVRGLSLVAASGGHSSSRCAGLSLSRPLLLRSTGSRRAGSVVVAHGPSCSRACGIFPDQGSNACPLHWQADSQPLRHQGSPWKILFCK